MRETHFAVVSALLLFLNAAQAAVENRLESLPEPLTLEYALSIADSYHPDLAIAESGVRLAEADLLAKQSGDDLDIKVQALAQWIDPAEKSPYQQTDNHRLSLLINKRLYDFGQQSARESAAQNNLASVQQAYLGVRQQRRLEIARKFFDVLQADLMFYQYNEAMASAYVRLDKLRDRQKVGQVNELEVLEQNIKYEEMRRMRTFSRNNQRTTRSALALAMGNPQLVADTLAKPDLSLLERKLPDVEELQQQAIENNYAIKQLKAKLLSAQQLVEAARKSNNPVLNAQLEAHEYSRQTGSTDPWRAGLVLNIPISDGDRTDAKVASSKAGLYRAQSQLEKAEFELKQDILQLYLQMESMQVMRDQARALTDYSELYLDKSRTLYEMEVQSTLGDAMITVTKAQYQALKADLDLLYAHMKMDALTGSLIKEQ